MRLPVFGGGAVCLRGPEAAQALVCASVPRQLLSRANASAGEKFQLFGSQKRRCSGSIRAEEKMKTCPVCALDLEDSYLFCPDDGSSLGARAASELAADAATEAAANSLVDPVKARERADETAGAVVLYCPTCAVEYPLTFSECPVHRLPLSRHKMPGSSSQEATARANSNNDNNQLATEARLNHISSKPFSKLTSLALERPRIERSRLVNAAAVAGNDVEFGRPPRVASGAPDGQDTSFEHSETSDPIDGNRDFDHRDFLADVEDQRSKHSGFRVAAIATVILLAVLSLAALYSVVSHLSRRSPRPEIKASQTEAAQPFPFIATPQEAQDYKEPSPLSSASSEPEQGTEPRVERKLNEAASPPAERNIRNTTVAQLPAAPAPAPAPVKMTTDSGAGLPPLPRGNSGAFDARLVRVRSMKTPAGFRYDLTFNMQEQAGRSALWQRLLITSRSASGISHSQAIPFVHRLGATGALTFTISVEMAGRSESDWQGRVVCTTFGWDNNDRALQASFGANVTP